MNKFIVSNQIYAGKASTGAFTQGTKLSSLDGSTTALTLKTGSILVVNDRDEILVAGNSGYLAGVKYVRFVVGTGKNIPHYITEPIYRFNAVEVEYENYCAPVKQVTFVGAETTGASVGDLNIPDPIVPSGGETEGYSACIRVTERGNLNQTRRAKMRRYELTIPPSVAASAVPQTVETYVVTQMVIKINADTDGIVLAAAVGASGSEEGISLTADNFGTAFDVSVEGVLEYADVVTPFTTGVASEPKSSVEGYGRPFQIKEIELRANTEIGRNTNRDEEKYRTWKDASTVCELDSCGYEVLTIREKDFTPNGIGEIVPSLQRKPQLKVAVEGTLSGGVPTGAWTISNTSNVKTILDALLPVIFGAGALTTTTIVEPATDIT